MCRSFSQHPTHERKKITDVAEKGVDPSRHSGSGLPKVKVEARPLVGPSINFGQYRPYIEAILTHQLTIYEICKKQLYGLHYNIEVRCWWCKLGSVHKLRAQDESHAPKVASLLQTFNQLIQGIQASNATPSPTPNSILPWRDKGTWKIVYIIGVHGCE